MIHPVILCGGLGTRLWPASRKAYPKQFAPLIGSESLYQRTLRRFSGPRFAAPLVITVEDFRFMATDQAAEIGLADARVIIEPLRRDSAPAVLVAALLLMAEDPDALMLVAPSDHMIEDLPAFLDAIDRASAASGQGRLMTFAVAADRPETGYGYLKLAPQADTTSGDPVPLEAFHEKPDLEMAQRMLGASNVLWNAGIFLFRAADVIAAFETHAPELLDPCRAAIATGQSDLGFFRLGAEAYERIEPVSFDYAVMEKAEHRMAVPLGGGWVDLGSWDALWRLCDTDEAGVAIEGAVTAVECQDSYLRSEDEAMHVVGLGLTDLVVVAMRDAVLVADKSRIQDVKVVVQTLREAGVAQAEEHLRFYRPWGWYETLCLGTRFQVKRIMVAPGGELSLQSHHHRSEHWIVVAGTAKVTVGEEVRLVAENEGVYIPLGTVHRLSNPGKLPMYLIEVQTGPYLGEDDIIRYEDVYSRA